MRTNIIKNRCVFNNVRFENQPAVIGEMGLSVRQYLQKYPNGNFSSITRNRIKAMATQAVVAVQPAVQANGKFTAGGDVDVEWKGAWYPPTVMDARAQGKDKIHYQGYASSWDEVVGSSRIRVRE